MIKCRLSSWCGAWPVVRPAMVIFLLGVLSPWSWAGCCWHRLVPCVLPISQPRGFPFLFSAHHHCNEAESRCASRKFLLDMLPFMFSFSPLRILLTLLSLLGKLFRYGKEILFFLTSFIFYFLGRFCSFIFKYS